jgi:hypothetical protein
MLGMPNDANNDGLTPGSILCVSYLNKRTENDIILQACCYQPQKKSKSFTVILQILTNFDISKSITIPLYFPFQNKR